MNFAEFFPDLRPWVLNLADVWPAPMVQPQFAHWEIWHIVSLFLLGGCIILMSLRLIGAGLTSEPPSVIEKNVRPWLAFGVFGVLASGVLIGMANAEKLYDSPAFLVKMISLLAAIIFTYAVAVPTAKRDGAVGNAAKVGFAVAMAAWLVSLWIFSTVPGLTPGVIHVIVAGALVVLAALKGRARWIFAAGLALIVVAHQVVTHVVISDPYDLARLDPANLWFTRAEALWVVAFAAYQIFASRNVAAGGALTRLVGYSTILVWVTVAAAGRWIAFAS